jgi:anti-sigma factor RsiW
MANERQQRLMQEALDERLSPEQYQELVKELDRDTEGSAQFSRLKQADQLLRTAPHERAPQRLALGIMARLAESMQSHQLSRVSGLALALGLALVMLVTMPLLIAAVALFLNAVGSAAALNAVVAGIATLLTVVVAMLEVFVQSAQKMVTNYPQAPLLLAGIIPVALLWLARYVFRRRAGDDNS